MQGALRTATSWWLELQSKQFLDPPLQKSFTSKLENQNWTTSMSNRSSPNQNKNWRVWSSNRNVRELATLTTVCCLVKSPSMLRSLVVRAPVNLASPFLLVGTYVPTTRTSNFLVGTAFPLFPLDFKPCRTCACALFHVPACAACPNISGRMKKAKQPFTQYLWALGLINPSNSIPEALNQMRWNAQIFSTSMQHPIWQNSWISLARKYGNYESPFHWLSKAVSGCF